MLTPYKFWVSCLWIEICKLFQICKPKGMQTKEKQGNSCDKVFVWPHLSWDWYPQMFGTPSEIFGWLWMWSDSLQKSCLKFHAFSRERVGRYRIQVKKIYTTYSRFYKQVFWMPVLSPNNWNKTNKLKLTNILLSQRTRSKNKEDIQAGANLQH